MKDFQYKSDISVHRAFVYSACGPGSGEIYAGARMRGAITVALIVLLAIWFLVSFGFGILLVEPLNRIRVGGFQLGFWFAQQGSIYIFVVLIFVYVRLMNRLDHEFDVDEESSP